MREIVYFTNDMWWDTDITILPDLGNKYDLEVFSVSSINPNNRKYIHKQLPSYITLHDFSFFKKICNIKTAWSSFSYGIRLLLSSKKKLVFWVVDYNIYYGILLILFLSSNRTIISLHNYIEHGDAGINKRLIRKLLLWKFKYFHFFSFDQEAKFKADYPKGISFSSEMPIKDFGRDLSRIKFFNNRKRTYLFFGGIRDYKRLDLFIDAMNIIGDKANFIVAGNCDKWEFYENKIINKESCILDIKYIKNEDIPSYFAQSDFLILPYDDSTQSGPLLIAYNYNLPIIASSLPYFERMIDDGVTGLIFEKGNVHDLVRQILKTITMTEIDYRKMKQEMSQKVNRYIKYTIFCDALEQFINKHIN